MTQKPQILAVLPLLLLPLVGADVESNGVETAFTSSVARPYDSFGHAVAVGENLVVVGAYRSDFWLPDPYRGGQSAGAAYVYSQSQEGDWTETMLIGEGVSHRARFGESVAISGDKLLIGAPGDSADAQNAGSAYLYEPDGSGGWDETKITPSDPEEGAQFGSSVSISGDELFIGTRGRAFNPDQIGSAYHFAPDGAGGWAETKFTASDATPGDAFGWSVAISGSNLLVGAYSDAHAGRNSGSAYHYGPDGAGGWDETKLVASDAASGDFFGLTVAAFESSLLIGAYGNDDQGSQSGSAYLYEPDGTGGWEETKFTASDADEGDRFGLTVAIDDQTVIVGADGDGDAGSAYHYAPRPGGGWFEHKITAGDGNRDDLFGRAVGISPDFAVIGAPRSDDAALNAGKAYLRALDSDGDDLLNADERELGTDPHNPDTDGDGLDDGDELVEGCDPLDPDTDGDLHRDGSEVESGTDCDNPTSFPVPPRVIADAADGIALPVTDDQEPIF